MSYKKPPREYQWKKGQSGNFSGRPKGKSLKEYSREMLAKMTDDERQEFMDGLPKEAIWRMAEGNPMQGTELSGEIITRSLTDEQAEQILQRRARRNSDSGKKRPD